MADPAESPVEALKSLKGKGIAGMPLPLVGAALAVGVVLALRLRRSSSSPVAVVDPTAAANAATQATAGSSALNLTPQDPQAAGSPIGTRPAASNDEWANLAVSALVVHGANAYTAQQTVARYLNGDQLTAEQAGLIDAAMRAVGPAPMPPPSAPAPLPPAAPAAATPASPPAGAPTTSTPSRTYTVVRGDSLAKIAARFGTTATRIYAVPANRAVIGPNPNLIKPGQVLAIPS